ncbi:hypothetical protein GCM10011400_19060 [Paraburkholderia caffeinilytica]|uniref:Uncharacterized protein n=1 Tax=Paraburkholderia caffeinilytica TaxID=1761016 RepID=A0ABQ1M083_9BURK|nr:hypothetical protein GCM10011400_19060 [Paraburkholderia caffeinilytica]
MTLPLNKTRALAYRGRDEKSRESAHGHCGYGQALTGYTNALRIGKEWRWESGRVSGRDTRGDVPSRVIRTKCRCERAIAVVMAWPGGSAPCCVRFLRAVFVPLFAAPCFCRAVSAALCVYRTVSVA